MSCVRARGQGENAPHRAAGGAPRSSRGQAIRLDKWLWAARFYKTRSLAKVAINGGKVHVNGARAKASKHISEGDTLTVTRGDAVQIIVVVGLAERRASAMIAKTLYEETPDSLASRRRHQDQRRLERACLTAPKRRPTKQERRQLKALKAEP